VGEAPIGRESRKGGSFLSFLSLEGKRGERRSSIIPIFFVGRRRKKGALPEGKERGRGKFLPSPFVEGKKRGGRV